MSQSTEPEARVVADLVKEHIHPQVIKVNDGLGEREVLILPTSLEAHSVKELLDEYRTAPERSKGTAELTELDSFVAHVNRFKNDQSALFADRDRERPALLAVIDYHDRATPRFGEHRAHYAFPVSEEWKSWTKQDGQVMSQEAFALWLEDHLGTVIDPGSAKDGAKQFLELFGVHFGSAQQLLELSRGLTVHVGAKVQNHQNLSSGEGRIGFAAAHTDEEGKPLRVPGAFLLGLQVFRGGALYQIPARLRYRVGGGGSIAWSYNLWRHADAFDVAIGDSCAKAQEETKLSLFYGTPEK